MVGGRLTENLDCSHDIHHLRMERLRKTRKILGDKTRSDKSDHAIMCLQVCVWVLVCHVPEEVNLDLMLYPL